MRNLWWQLKQFFQAFPAPGSWAYRLAGWRFNKKQDKEKQHVYLESRDGDAWIQLTYEGPPDSFDWGLWTGLILGAFDDKEEFTDFDPDSI